ncbi:MAG: glutamate--tRNA ligase [Christensenellaceae bacterium]|nr:glutamate--tRNA ligase [Christensenellaceae bacterium]MDD6926331.1 glutamate--tRNA ligase [bacterium]
MDYQLLASLLFPEVTETPEDMEKRFPPRNVKEGAIISRMAPSPTGFVHLGNLVQGLTSERLCHQSGGVLFLRVEDTDKKREVPGAVEVLIETLKHYGIHFDEGATVDSDSGDYGPYRQSRRAAIYHVYAKQLVLQGQAYPCFCTEEELQEIHAEQEKENANFGYFGKWAKWRDRPIEDIKEMLDKGMPWVLRFRSTGNIENKIKFTDLIKGEIEVTENDIDHVLLKSDGIPTYHFAHAVDDHLMRTTHVVRGDEWLSTLPFHLQLFRALGFKPPKYCHIGPLMKMDGSSKRKLSKRKDPELALTYYKAEGFPVEAVYEYILTVLNSNFEDWRRANPDASTDDFKFSYKKMNPAGSLFDAAKLKDVSKNVISKMSAEKVCELATEWANEFDKPFGEKLSEDKEKAVAIFSIGRGGKKPRKDYAVWSELKDYMGFFYDEFFEFKDALAENFDKNVVKNILSEYDYNEEADQTEWFENIKALGEKHNFASDMKAYKAQPENYAGSVADVSGFIRLAVTGKNVSPDMYLVMKILGKEKVNERINKFVASL